MNRAVLVKSVFAICSAVLPTTVFAQSTSPAICATPAQQEIVRAALADKEPGPLYGVASSLKLPESVVASALPIAEAHGVSATHFPQIWKSLEAWDDAMTLVTKGPNVIEISGPVGIGEPSKRSKFFNLSRRGAGLKGHLRPDLYSAIYAVSRTGKESTLRGVTFYDQAGEAVFSVFLPGEGETPPPSLVKQFETTWSLIKSLPMLCGR